MSMLKIFDISGSAVSAQAQRLNAVASNLANVDTVAGPDGQPYKAREVVFQTAMMGAQGDLASAGVKVVNVTEDQKAGRKVLDPTNPQADSDGYVTYSLPAQTNLDSNTVDMDRERASFVDNTVKYQATLTFINGQVRNLLDAMKPSSGN